MKSIGDLLLFILVLGVTMSISMVVFVLQVHIIYDIADLYNVWGITLVPIEVMYGTLIVLGLIRYKYEKDKEIADLEWDDRFVYNLGAMANRTLAYLISWGVAYLFHLMMF